MMLAGRNWIGGQAHPDLGVIAIAVPNVEGYTSRMKRYIPHEITHLLVYQLVTPQGYQHVPEWLDEGLATANERLPTPEHAMALEQASEGGNLLPLRDLCAPFSPDSETAFLSYAQSGSTVKYIRERYGADGIRKLLAAYRDGASCESGIKQALQVSLYNLETAWRGSLTEAPSLGWLQKVAPWASLWIASLLVAIPMIGRFRRERNR